jgi:hypothetical protein
MLKYKFAIILMNVSLMLTCSIVKDIHAKHQQTSSTIEQAKANLERLQTQLSLVEKDARGEIEKIIAEQVNNAPKGEFETTREYEARKAKANELRGQIEERINKKKEARKDELNRRINNIRSYAVERKCSRKRA